MPSSDISIRILKQHSQKFMFQCVVLKTVDLIVLDVMLPELDGLSVCRLLSREIDIYAVLCSLPPDATPRQFIDALLMLGNC